MRALRRFCAALLVICMAAGCVSDISALEYPNCGSKAAVLMDFETGEVLYSKNGDMPLPTASTAKLMTAYLVYDAMEDGVLSEDTLLTVSPSAFAVAGNYSLTNVAMEEGGRYTVSSLMEAMLVVSACGASVVLAEGVSGSEVGFVEDMNRMVSEMGLNGHFEDSYGLSSHDVMSARSMAVLSKELIERFPQVLEITSKTSIEFAGKKYGCTHSFLPGCSAYYPGVDGLKTGSTTPAGKCLVTTGVRDGRRLITVVLGASDSEIRKRDTKAMLDYGFSLDEIPEPQPVPDPELAPQPEPDTRPIAMDAAEKLYSLNILRGVGSLPDGSADLALESVLTREQALTLLVRLLGEEEQAMAETAPTGFVDVTGWSQPIVAYAHWSGLVNGVTPSTFEPKAACDVRSYLTMIYRALGYTEGYSWREALAFAPAVGLELDGVNDSTPLTREIAAEITWSSLSCGKNDGSGLAAYLVSRGVFDIKTAESLGLEIA